MKKNIADSLAGWVIEQTSHVIGSFGPRAAGSPGERAAQSYIAEVLSQWAGTVRQEPFTLAPLAFPGWTKLAGPLLVLSCGLYWLAPVAALVSTLLALLIFVFELVLYREFIDPLFPKAQSVNVYGTIAPRGPVRRRLIIGGHTDAAFEWRFNHYGHLIPLVAISNIIGIVAILGTDIAATVAAPIWAELPTSAWLIIGLIRLVFVPAFVALTLYSNLGQVVPGANDNLSAVFMTLAIARHLREADIVLEHTEVGLLLTGSEESGLRGAKAFVNHHAADLGDVETVFVALETFSDLQHLAIYERDMNNLVRHDEGACRLLQEAGTACGVEIPRAGVFLGSTDATAFTQGGIKAVALAAMDPAPAHFYHSRRDDVDTMDRECIATGLQITLAALERYDQGGLPT